MMVRNRKYLSIIMALSFLLQFIVLPPGSLKAADAVITSDGSQITTTTPSPPSGQYLKGCWTFDEASGTTAADTSGSGNAGTLLNGPVWTTGKVNGGLNFDGVNDMVTTGTDNYGISDQLTTCAWIRMAGPNSLNGEQVVIW
ncbi:MAG: hypothetical protein ACM3UZ_02655 [Acidobacteriota bacterium]